MRAKKGNPAVCKYLHRNEPQFCTLARSYLHGPPQRVVVVAPDHVDEEAQVLLVPLRDGHVAPEAEAVAEDGRVERRRVEDVRVRVPHLLLLLGKVGDPPEVAAPAEPPQVPGGLVVTPQLHLPQESLHPPPLDLQPAVLLLELDHPGEEVLEQLLRGLQRGARVRPREAGSAIFAWVRF